MLPVLVNAVVYQCVWFACVLGAASGHRYAGYLAAGAALLWHLWGATRPAQALRLVALAAAIGAVFETLLMASGWARMAPDALLWGFTPLWMVALWGSFATTLNVSLRRMRERPLLLAAIAAVGAPLAYQAGVKLGALQWVEPVPALLFIGAGWALATPLLLAAARRFDGFRPAAAAGVRP
jgi:hypothetical protein